MGGFIFIISTILAIVFLWLYGSLEITSNLVIVGVVFDDFILLVGQVVHRSLQFEAAGV